MHRSRLSIGAHQNRDVAGTTEADSGWSYTVPANTLKVGQVLRVSVFGTLVNAGGGTTGKIKLVFGSTTIDLTEIGGWTNATGAWKAQVYIYVTGASAQLADGWLFTRDTGSGHDLNGPNDFASPTEAVSGTILIKTRLKATDAGQTIRQKFVLVEILGAAT